MAVAVRRIQEIIDQHVQMSGVPKSPTVGVVTYPATSTNGSFGLTPSMSASHLPIGVRKIKLYIQSKAPYNEIENLLIVL